MTHPSPAAPGRPESDPLRRVAGVLCAVHAVALLGFVVFYLWELWQGASDDATRVVMSAVLIAVFAVLLGLVARGWLRGQDWPKTATVVWNILLLPVAWSLIQADQALVGVGLGVVAVVGAVAAIGARSAEDLDEG